MCGRESAVQSDRNGLGWNARNVRGITERRKDPSVGREPEEAPGVHRQGKTRSNPVRLSALATRRPPIGASNLSARPQNLDLFDDLPEALAPSVADEVESLARMEGLEGRGAVFTRKEVVGFILDLTGYRADRPLHRMRLLEPCFGGGDFLLVAAERLLGAWRRAGSPGEPEEALGRALIGVELHRKTFDETRGRLIKRLEAEGLGAAAARRLADAWLIQGDFLLAPLAGRFDFVVGNPPYVRQELIPDALLQEYKRRYATLYDRADLYIPFIERSLRLLARGGCSGFICSDRWMKNRYGAPLRGMVAEGFHLRVLVDMVDADAFHREVIAYPAITVIANESPGPTRLVKRPEIDAGALARLARELEAGSVGSPESGIRVVEALVQREEPWLVDSSEQMALLRRLEAAYPTLEEAGCKVGIGVATGADKAFIGEYETLDVEAGRKLPLVRTRDIQSGEVVWRGDGVINPFADEGGLVDLARYPKLRRYLEARREVIAGRHCAKKNPAGWYRTIDRIFPPLTKQPKLLIPDIKGEAHIVYESGRYYPHHNLYYITADRWDLRALQAVLRSGIARLFVAAYSTKMRGGYLRFQAQYLRRIRIPNWDSVSEGLRTELTEAAGRGDQASCNRAVARLYGLTEDEELVLRGEDKR